LGFSGSRGLFACSARARHAFSRGGASVTSRLNVPVRQPMRQVRHEGRRILGRPRGVRSPDLPRPGVLGARAKPFLGVSSPTGQLSIASSNASTSHCRSCGMSTSRAILRATATPASASCTESGKQSCRSRCARPKREVAQLFVVAPSAGSALKQECTVTDREECSSHPLPKVVLA
jgi:hypothetical protein